MQRALSFEDTPALGVPLRFMLSAPVFAAAAGLLLAYGGATALQTRWSPYTIGLTHLMTLGFLGMAMVGAVLQMLPVVAGAPVPGVRLVAQLAWYGLAGGTPLLAAGLMAGVPLLVGLAAPLLGLPLLTFVAAVAYALVKRSGAGALPMVAGMRFALPSLGLTALLGVSLAAWLAGGPALAAPLLTDLHAAWGLLGWVAMLVAAAAFQVIPMFQSTPAYPRKASLVLPPLLALALLGWSAAAWLGEQWQAWLGRGLALALAAFALFTLYLLGRRGRSAADTTTCYWRLALASLFCSTLLYAWPGEAGDWRPLVVGVLFIGGFAMSAVSGMLYKIVPFLLWYHLAEAGTPRDRVPGVNHWIAPQRARGQFWCHAAAVAALACAPLAPPLARAGGLLLALDAAWLGTLLAAAALRYRALATLSPRTRAGA
jgi:hypothetical protein